MIGNDQMRRIKRLALSGGKLERALISWHGPSRKKSFDAWLERLIRHVGKQIDEDDDDSIMCALRLQAIGDPLAIREASTAKVKFRSDINCIVEEGFVFSNVWIKGMRFKEVEEEGWRISAAYNHAGYSAFLYLNKKLREATVMAQISFHEYMELEKGFLCDGCKCGKLQNTGNRKESTCKKEKASRKRSSG